ncbi:MAG TPA: hypothetical protein VLT89_02015 [Usitatibacter sp.]|nr:hypothetical protein [Usitatibacter sp.]
MEPEIARDATYYRAPDALRQRIEASVGGLARQERVPAMRRGFLMAAAFAAVALVSWNLALLHVAARADDTAHDVLSAHMRSLMAPGRVVDVESSDQHTVKPWFAGKLDYAPPVHDFSADGYPLVGGRLDYVDGHPVAALAYKRRMHTVSLFVWPEAGTADTQPKVSTLKGYSLATWTRGSMRYWAACDAAPSELARFADLMSSAPG